MVHVVSNFIYETFCCSCRPKCDGSIILCLVTSRNPLHPPRLRNPFDATYAAMHLDQELHRVI